MYDIVLNISAFILLVSIVTFVHEFGHYFVAKLCGVKVEVFSIGFGPKIFGFTDKSGTNWRVSIIPLGGYVRFFGDVNEASMPDYERLKSLTKEESKLAFCHKNIYQKMAIVTAGPLVNFLFAIFTLTILLYAYPKPYATTEIGYVEPNSVAKQAGLEIGDRIIDISGSKVNNFEEMRAIISVNADKKLIFTIERNNQILEKEIIPFLADRENIFGDKIKIGTIGVAPVTVLLKENSVIEALTSASTEIYEMSYATYEAIYKMISGKKGTEDLGGPLQIAKYSGQSMKYGISAFLLIISIISLNLAIVNLLPIPLLDGGHLLYYIIEAVTGRPLHKNIQSVGFYIGLIIIFSIMVIGLSNDVQKIFIK